MGIEQQPLRHEPCGLPLCYNHCPTLTSLEIFFDPPLKKNGGKLFEHSSHDLDPRNEVLLGAAVRPRKLLKDGRAEANLNLATLRRSPVSDVIAVVASVAVGSCRVPVDAELRHAERHELGDVDLGYLRAGLAEENLPSCEKAFKSIKPSMKNSILAFLSRHIAGGRGFLKSLLSVYIILLCLRLHSKG